jgi:hypothetical protein
VSKFLKIMLMILMAMLLGAMMIGKALDLEAERTIHNLYARDQDGIIEGLILKKLCVDIKKLLS